MTKKRPTAAEIGLPEWYWSPNIPMSAIRRFARQVAKRFQPERILLFGSYAYGRPHEWSDVDILVVMPTRNELDQALRIWNAIDPPFSVDIVVRTPRNLSRRLQIGDQFLREVIGKGKVLYENDDGRVGPESSGRSSRRATTGARKATTT
jgi:predicted nucleotidyltransferase